MNEKLKLGSQDWLLFNELEPEVPSRSQISVPQVSDQRGAAKDETSELIRSFREKHQRLTQPQPTFYVQGVQSKSSDSLPPYQRTSSPTPTRTQTTPSEHSLSNEESPTTFTSSVEQVRGVSWTCNRPFVAVNEQIRQLYVTVAEQLSHHVKKSDKVRRLLKEDGPIKYILNKASTKIVQIEKFEPDEDLANELITAVGKLAISFVSVCVTSHRTSEIIKLFDDGLHRLLRRAKVDPTTSSVSSVDKTGSNKNTGSNKTSSDIRLFNSSSSSLSQLTSSLKESRTSKDWKAKKEKKSSSRYYSSSSSSASSSFTDLTLNDSSMSSLDRSYAKKQSGTRDSKRKEARDSKKESKARDSKRKLKTTKVETPISRSIKSAQTSRAVWSQAFKTARDDKTSSSGFSSLTLSSSHERDHKKTSRRTKDKRRTKEPNTGNSQKKRRSSGSSYLKSNSSVERQLFGGSDSLSDLTPIRVGFYQKNLPSSIFQPRGARPSKTTKTGVKRTFH